MVYVIRGEFFFSDVFSLLVSNVFYLISFVFLGCIQFAHVFFADEHQENLKSINNGAECVLLGGHSWTLLALALVAQQLLVAQLVANTVAQAAT